MNKFSLLLVFFLSGGLYANPTSWGGGDGYGLLILLGLWGLILLAVTVSFAGEFLKEIFSNELSALIIPIVLLIASFVLVSVLD